MIAAMIQCSAPPPEGRRGALYYEIKTILDECIDICIMRAAGTPPLQVVRYYGLLVALRL